VREKSWQRVDGLEVAYLEHGKLVISQSSLPSVGTDMTAHFRKGQVLGWGARLASGIVQRAGQLP
jgi:hypothetical protein